MNIRDLVETILDRYRRCARGMLPDDYQMGYEEACDHIVQAAEESPIFDLEQRIKDLEEALVWATWTMHGTPQYMLPNGISIAAGACFETTVQVNGKTIHASAQLNRSEP